MSAPVDGFVQGARRRTARAEQSASSCRFDTLMCLPLMLSLLGWCLLARHTGRGWLFGYIERVSAPSPNLLLSRNKPTHYSAGYCYLQHHRDRQTDRSRMWRAKCAAAKEMNDYWGLLAQMRSNSDGLSFRKMSLL